MTIVAGFPGTGFVVLAADSDEAGAHIKSSVRKIAVLDKGDCKCIIGGAGNGDFIDLAVQQINAELKPPYTVATVNELIEDVVTDIYSDRIDSYPAHEQDDLGFELLCAVWVKDDPVAPQLIRVRRAVHLIRTAPETIGVGSYLARYLIATFAQSPINLMQAYRLAVYLVAQVKKHAQDCGGASQVVGISADGRVVELWPATITTHESTASVVMERAMPFLLFATDPYAFDHGNIGNLVDIAAGHIKTELAALMPQLPTRPAQPTPAVDAVPDAATVGDTMPASAPVAAQPVKPDRRATIRARRALTPSPE